MGTVNYKTSDYITLGIEPLSAYDLERDPVFMEEIAECAEEWNMDTDEAIYCYIRDTAEDDQANIECELKKHHFHYYHIKIEPGYYEGFSLDIESNFPIAFNDWQEKREAQKEITEIKQFLLTCVDLGLCEVWPGWCTSYKDRPTTIQAINKAVKEMREEARQTPTWSQYERQEAI